MTPPAPAGNSPRAASIEAALARLLALCRAHALPLDDAQLDLFGRYVDALLTLNQAMNLIGPMDAMRVVEELCFDSLLALKATSWDGQRVLDVGTGAGLPGIPLALASPLAHLTLVEPRQKRVTFLRVALTRLHLDDRVTIVHDRVQALPPEQRWDRVISKAFEPPIQWLQTASGLIGPGGQILCMTRTHERQGLDARAQALGLRQVGQAARQGDPDRLVLAYASA